MAFFSNKPLLNYAQRLQRLRIVAGVFFLLLLLPLGLVLYFALMQVEQTTVSKYQREANSLVQLASRHLLKKRLLPNALDFDAFEYYQQVYNPLTKQPQKILSPLSQLDFNQPKISQQMRGLVGFFQYDHQGRFNSPIWPYDLTLKQLNQNSKQASTLSPELLLRKETALKIYQILDQSQAIQQMLKQGFEQHDRLFNMIFDMPEYFIFYRVVPVNEQKHLQGYLVERKAYLTELFIDVLHQARFDSSILIKLKDEENVSHPEYFFYENLVNNQTKVTQPQQAEKHLQQELLYKSSLGWPFDGYSVSFSTHALPMTSTMLYTGAFMLILVLAILVACYGFYRLGVRQLILGEQRLNFVSSVSHELKTPLTSIRMYAQMLKEGAVLSPEHRQDYHEFIYAESERLTRLINNILQLSHLTHQQQAVEPEYVAVTILQDIIRSKVSSMLDKSAFQQNIQLEMDNAESVQVFVEKDAFSQVIINITDNTLKFFDRHKIKDSRRQKIDFIFRPHPKSKQMVEMEIRDYGQGISQEQANKVFELFYRGGDELTRTTQGTGIGLALVNELVLAQQAEIRLERKNPGLAILIAFKARF